MRNHQNDVLPTTPPTPMRKDAAVLADELSKTAGATSCPRMQELRKFEATAENMLVAGNCSMGELIDAPSYERTHLYAMLSDEKPSWARPLRKMLDTRAPPSETEAEQTAP